MRRDWAKMRRHLEDECRACGDTRDLAPHHVVYRSLGGSDSALNVIALCPHCHRSAHDKLLDVWTLLTPLERANAAREMGSEHRARVFLSPKPRTGEVLPW